MQASSQAIRLAHVRAHIEAAEDPVRVFAHEYDQGDADTQDALYAVWESKFMSRAEDPSLAERRFDQYLSLGRRSKPRRTAKAIRDAVGLASGARTKIQFLLGKTAPFRMPEWMWVVVYKTRMRLVSLAAQAAVAADPAMALLAPMVYIGHRRDSVVVWDRVRLSDARRRTRSANGLVELTRLLLGAGLSHGAGGDFVFDEFYQEEVLGRVDHGHGLEASNAIDASVREDQVRLDVIEDFLNGNGPHPFNAKIDNSLLGVTNVSGLLGAHNRPLSQLDVPALRRKLAEARAVLGRKRGAYTRKFMRDEVGRRDLPKPGVTEDGLGQTRAAQLTQPQRAARLRAMNAAAV
eukprot:jgi/Tetstr1/443143/TSEL_003232.t1